MARRYRKEKELTYISMNVVAGVPLFYDRRLMQKMSNGLKWSCDRRGLRVYEYVILPDRILLMGNTAWGTFDDVILGFRTFSSKAVMRILREGQKDLFHSWVVPVLSKFGSTQTPDGITIWDNRDQKRILHQQQDIDATALACRNAPVVRGIVEKPDHYLHSSAHPGNPLEGWQVAVTDRGI